MALAMVAKLLILYARHHGLQSQFSPVLQAQVRGDSPFADLISCIQNNLDAPLYVPSLAERAGLSERTFRRRFVAGTGQTPARYVETPGSTRRACCCHSASRSNRMRRKSVYFRPRGSQKPSRAGSALPQDCSATCMPDVSWRCRTVARACGEFIREGKGSASREAFMPIN